MMDEKGAARQFTRREERRLLELASEYVRSGFPNPERSVAQDLKPSNRSPESI